MWTNVFKIGGLHQISWFQFLPNESDLSSLSDKSLKIDQKDGGTQQVLSAHHQLQKEGFLSAWTNSFVGPWDPSQGLHNPDEKIKLWLFLPGHHSSVLDKAKSAVSRLRILTSGIWVAPGDSEEVAAAISQALRNSIERALKGFSYMRFGDVFSRYHPFSQNEELFRKGHPVVEFIFAATEEAIFVHVVISGKHVRALSSGDIETVLHQSANSSRGKLPVIVSPHGMRGTLTGCFPSDLVKQVYLSSGKSKASNGTVGLPYTVSQGSGCQLRGQSCYVEVTLGSPDAVNDKGPQRSSNANKNVFKQLPSESPAMGKAGQKSPTDQASVCEKIFIYPVESVLVPVMQTSSARSYLKRFWLQNWIGPSLSGASLFMHCNGKGEYRDGSWPEANSIRSQHGFHSSSNSNSSSISSISSSSSDSDFKTSGAGDLEADADSLVCGQSGLSFNDQSNHDPSKLGSKRTRAGVSESFSQSGSILNPLADDFGDAPVGWDDDDQGIVMDIEVLLSEFGDFGDFFETDDLPFGEPPGGTTESQVTMLTAPEGGDVSNSPSTSMMDVVSSDQILLPVGILTPTESFNPTTTPIPTPLSMDDSLSKIQEIPLVDPSPSVQMVSTPLPRSDEFDHVVKAEAIMTFAPEYGAVETITSNEFTSSIFKSPYLPKSRKAETAASSSNNYVYSATPPSPSDEQSRTAANSKGFTNTIPQSKRYYTHVEIGSEKTDGKLATTSNANTDTRELVVAGSSFSGSNSTNAVRSAHSDVSLRSGLENFLPSQKTVLATEVECLRCQAFMCKIRHTLSSSTNPSPRLSGSMISNHPHAEPSIIPDRFEMKRKESIPIRLGGDIDGGLLDGSNSNYHAPVGVWRTVGVTKATKANTLPSMEVSPSVPHNSFIEESMLSYGLRQPLHELLDGIALLVQHATSFVDVALDADCSDGPFGWLAIQEQRRRGFCCGPSMVHAGCGGLLSSCHSLDIAGVELVDPFSADVQASLTISLLQSDIKSALKSAFGTLDGPLTVSDWCRGRSQSSMEDGFSAESTASASEGRDSSSTVTLSVGESLSPTQSSCLKDGIRVIESSERRLNQEAFVSESDQQRVRPTLAVVPFPAMLVGYQDDWLKTSTNSIQFWEKAPFEPYATQKHMTYYVVCPDIDPLTTAAADFFQQLGTVYETCKLGTHSPQSVGNEMEIDSGKLLSSGFVLLDCPQSMKIDSSSASMLGSISDYFLSLSNGWDVASYLKSLSKVLKTLKLGSCMSTNAKEGNSGSCMVIYVVCPFPEPLAVLQAVIESSVAIGSVVLSFDKERRTMMHNQVGKALNHSASVDETLSNVLTLSGFSVPRLVLQIVTVDAIFRVTRPALNELAVLKEIAFTVYNKARRVSRGSSSNNTMVSSSLMSDNNRSHSSSASGGMWKECVGPRNAGSREVELDASSRAGAWENTWQTSRMGGGGIGFDQIRIGEFSVQDEIRCMFEPLFILAEAGSLERGVLPPIYGNVASESSRPLSDDGTSGNFIGDTDAAGMEHDRPQKNTLASLHCCYGWSEDWRWLVSIWTDSRGELLDSYIYPFGGISGRQDTKGLQSLFIQILQQGCQILQASPSDASILKPRDFVIARIGCFLELECQEWQKALYAIGGSEVKKWSLQLRRSMADGGIPSSSNGTSSLQQQEMNLIQSSSSNHPMYNTHTHSKTPSSFIKGVPTRKQQLIGDNSKGLHQWVQSICFVSLSVDHSLQLVLQADLTSPGASQGSGASGPPSYLEGYTPVKSLGSASASYILIPSPSLRFLPSAPLQLPTCLTAESPPLAHLLHSKGSAIPLSTAFVVSKAVPSMRKDSKSISKQEWPSVLSVGLVDYYGSSSAAQEKIVKGATKMGGKGSGSSSAASEARDVETEAHLILEGVAAELHALSWMTVSPVYLERRTCLPFHCDMVLRLRRLLYFADKELSKQSEKSQV